MKIYLKGVVINNFEDKELNRILLEGCKYFTNVNVNSIEDIQDDPVMEQFIIKMSPTILKYLRAKVKLFVKHVILCTGVYIHSTKVFLQCYLKDLTFQ